MTTHQAPAPELSTAALLSLRIAVKRAAERVTKAETDDARRDAKRELLALRLTVAELFATPTVEVAA